MKLRNNYVKAVEKQHYCFIFNNKKGFFLFMYVEANRVE